MEDQDNQPTRRYAAKTVALRHAGFALGTSVITAGSLTIVSILITRSLGVTGRGDIAAAVLIPTILAYLGQIGIPTAVGYIINQAPAKRAVTIATARTLVVAISIPLIILSAIIVRILPFDAAVRSSTLAFTLFIPFSIIAAVHSGILQADMRTKAFNLVRMVSAISYLGIVFSVILAAEGSTMTMVLSQLSSAALGAVISVVLVRDRPWFAFNRLEAQELLSYGARAHVGTLQPVDTLRIDQLILGLFLSTHALGTYVIAMTFVTANRLIGVSLGMVAFPIASNQGQAGTALLSTLTKATVILASLTAIVEITFGDLLLQLLFSVNSREAYWVMAVLIVGSVFMNVRQVVADILRGLGQPALPSLSEIVLVLSLLVLSLTLWNLGLVGIAGAVTLSTVIALSWLLHARSSLQ